jgi:hypothetical protein
MATYRGVPYEAGIGPADTDIVLFAACPPPEELGFEPATGHWRKQLPRQDVQALWESKPTGKFRGEGCLVLDDLGDRLHIAYLGHDAGRAEQLGYWEVDRGVFEMMTPRDEVTEVIEERVDYLHRPAGRPPAAADDRDAPAPTGGLSVPHVPRELGAPRDFGALGDLGVPGHFPASAGIGTPGDIVIPNAPAGERPLPLEEAARLAASARLEASARLASPLPGPEEGLLDGWPEAQGAPLDGTSWAARPGTAPLREDLLDDEIPSQPDSRRSRHDSGLRSRATQRIFTELADLAAIPPSAFAVGKEVDGAMCLLQTGEGFEVFNAADGARHEVRLFDDEESAYFYLFGVLAAEAIRTGRLAPQD